jgi:hypothetical protein
MQIPYGSLRIFIFTYLHLFTYVTMVQGFNFRLYRSWGRRGWHIFFAKIDKARQSGSWSISSTNLHRFPKFSVRCLAMLDYLRVSGFGFCVRTQVWETVPGFGFRVSACASGVKSTCVGFRVSGCASEVKSESRFRVSGFERRNQFSGPLSGFCLQWPENPWIIGIIGISFTMPKAVQCRSAVVKHLMLISMLQVLGCGIRRVLFKRADCIYDGIYRFHVERRSPTQSQIKFSYSDFHQVASACAKVFGMHRCWLLGYGYDCSLEYMPHRRDLTQAMFQFRDAYDDPYHHYKDWQIHHASLQPFALRECSCILGA